MDEEESSGGDDVLTQYAEAPPSDDEEARSDREAPGADMEEEEEQEEEEVESKSSHVSFAAALASNKPFKGPWKLLPKPSSLDHVTGTKVLHQNDDGDWCVGCIKPAERDATPGVHTHTVSFWYYKRNVRLDLDLYLPNLKMSFADCDKLPKASWVLLEKRTGENA